MFFSTIFSILVYEEENVNIYDFLLYLRVVQYVSANCFLFTLPVFSIERIIASTFVSSYEKFKNPIFLICLILFTWAHGIIAHYLIIGIFFKS